MKKLLLLITLITTTATAQTIPDRLDIIQEQVEQVRAELSVETIPVTNISAELSSDRIEVSWQAHSSGTMDIQYYAPEYHSEWQHSVARYRAPPNIEDEHSSIGVGIEADWLIRVVTDDWVSKPILLKYESTPQEAEKVDISGILMGYWDSHAAPADQPANIYKLPWNDLDRFPDSKVIPMIGGFNPEMPEADIRKRLSDRRDVIERASDRIVFIILQDEPFYGGFSPEQQELIVKAAKEEMGDYKYAYSYARGALRDQPDRDRRLPANLDVAVVNNYTFYYQDWWPDMYITTQDEFERDLKKTMDIVLAQVPEIAITGQAIYDDRGKYRKQPLESVDWYVEFVAKYDMAALLWFEYRDRAHWQGAGSRPELYEKHREVFEKITEQ